MVQFSLSHSLLSILLSPSISPLSLPFATSILSISSRFTLYSLYLYPSLYYLFFSPLFSPLSLYSSLSPSIPLLLYHLSSPLSLSPILFSLISILSIPLSLSSRSPNRSPNLSHCPSPFPTHRTHPHKINQSSCLCVKRNKVQ